MSKRFEYQHCYVVFDHVTLVNGVWQGANVPENQRDQKAVEECPWVWEYLQRAGADGWELVAVWERTVAGKQQQTVMILFLKRELT
jgi:hypothetical protein